MEPASPSPALIELTLTPATDSDRERLEHGLRVLTAEDPTIAVTADPASGISTIGVQGETHLEIVVDRLSREFHVSAGVTKPRVVYKEARFAQMTVLLEPVMRVEVVVHQQHLDAIVTDLVERHGWIGSTEERGGMHVVSAFVPLANLFGYMYYLRDATRGRGSFTMKLDRYEPVDDEVK
jgi:translation elongation factor EF-G